jgi:hypothetical protein
LIKTFSFADTDWPRFSDNFDIFIYNKCLKARL